MREAYEELFHINEKLTEADRDAIEGKFKSTHNVSERIAKEQTKTFYALLELADLDKAVSGKKKAHPEETPKADPKKEDKSESKVPVLHGIAGLRYNIEIHLPPTKDVEVYNAIFKSLKEHLLDS